MNPFPFAIKLNHSVATVCIIAGIMQTTRTVQPKTKDVITYAYIYQYSICVGVHQTMSCTWCLVVQCRWRLYNKNWNSIYSVQLLIFLFPFRSCSFNLFPFPLSLMELNSIRYR